MKIATFTSTLPTMGDTRTYENYINYLSVHPEDLGVVSRMYEELTAPYLTEALGNIFYKDTTKRKYESINTLAFDWEIEVNQIKRIEFAAVPEGDGRNQTEIIVAFRERYYDKYDTFKVDGSGLTCIVLSDPNRKADNYWEYVVRLVDTNWDAFLDLDYCQPFMTTRWISNYMPEMHDRGTVKWQSNVEKMRGYISTHRNDASYSALYAATEDTFVKVSEKKPGKSQTDTIYNLPGVDKNLLENFLQARNQALIFGKNDIDPKTGKPTIVDPQTNRPIVMSDGIIEQVEAYASKYCYNKLTKSVFDTAIMQMSKVAKKPTGNEYLFVCNEKAWFDLQHVLEATLSNYHTDGTVFWSQKANQYVTVGAPGFDTYRWGGNSVTFKVDRALTHEYGDKGYCLCLDLTADKTSAQPPIQMFTLKGGQMISNVLEGPGKSNGLTSGPVSTPVAATQKILWGY